jgi:hypothetical protein
MPVRAAEEFTVSIEAPWAAGFNDFERRFTIAVKEQNAGLAGGVFIGELDSRRPVPFDIDYRGQAVCEDAPDGGSALEILQFGQTFNPMIFVETDYDDSP